MSAQKVLIIDDDTAVCTSLSLLLRRAGYAVQTLSRPQEAADIVPQFQPDLVLLDMNFSINTSGKDGLKMLRQIRTQNPQLPVILITGWATVQLAVAGMKIGARDFIAKPWDNQELLSSVRTALQLSAARPERVAAAGFSHIVGNDPALQAVIDTARRVSRTKASVLITGESGTGKELIAEAIHYESDRADQPFVKVNLGGITDSLFESEMFGHLRGAFTDAYKDRVGRFALADGGTIFLDEIGDLPLGSQVKLLRVLQENTFEVLGSSTPRRVDVRVISATNKNLSAMVQAGTFREDLLYRINLITVSLPPLRQRPEDIPLLVEHFLSVLRQTYDRPDLQLGAATRDWLTRQSFPGNIRQLKNLVERTVLLSTDSHLQPEDFARNYDNPAFTQEDTSLPAVGTLSLEEMEIQAIRKALAFHQQQIAATARSLGITRSALYRRLEKYQIPYAP